MDISVNLPEIQISGGADLSVIFASYSAQMFAIVRNLTIEMRVGISRNLNVAFTNVTVSLLNACLKSNSLNFDHARAYFLNYTIFLSIFLQIL